MKLNFKAKFFAEVLIILALFAIAKNTFALEQEKKWWLGLNAQQTLSADKKWQSFIFTQIRMISRSHPWQVGLIETGLGYHFLENQSLWFGYRFSGHNPRNDFFQEQRLFQQHILQLKPNKIDKIVVRSRLEETYRGNMSPVSYRLRFRAARETSQEILWKIFPFVYDEIFIPLNKTKYTSNRFISENRLFLGFNFITSKTSWWEIGYMSQLLLPTPINVETNLDHVISFTYNFS